MKLIKTEEAVGSVLCHDITQIIPGVVKDAVFRRDVPMIPVVSIYPCLPDGPKVGSVALSPRGDWRMPSDACAALWLKELEQLQ